MTLSRPGRARGFSLVRYALLCATAFSLAATSSASASHSRQAGSARTLPHALAIAAGNAARADRRLVYDARSLRRCIAAHSNAPARCDAGRRAVQHAGSGLAAAEAHLAFLARSGSRLGSAARVHGVRRNPRLAPWLYVFKRTLHWTRVADISTYVVMRDVPGQGQVYEVIDGRSVTPPPVPGVTVSYRVRTTARGSAWSVERSISYPPAGTPDPTPDPQAAPWISVAGTTLTWNAVDGVGTYVLVSKVPGQADRYSEVSGTSTIPPAVPGASVRYSVRTAVEGSAWAPEVTIAYPAAPAPPPPAPTPPPSSPPPSERSFEMGVNAGTSTYELPFIQTVGAKTARLDVGIGTSASEIAPLVEAYAKAGVRLLLLAGFYGRVPSPADAQGVASWAAAYGPGGTFWQGKSFPSSVAVSDIEFGNETSYTYQFSDNSPSAYASRAREYALRFKEAQTAVQAANPNVGLLAQADSGGNGSEWVDNMFAAVPDLAQRVAGWTVHPYGSNWQARLDQLVSSTAAHGAPSTIPIWVTEWGLASDNGRCLNDNYGWNRCMSYAEEATTLTNTLSAMKARYGRRLSEFYLYHVRDQQPSGSTSDREAYFGAVQSDDAAKGPYTSTVQALFAANP